MKSFCTVAQRFELFTHRGRLKYNFLRSWFHNKYKSRRTIIIFLYGKNLFASKTDIRCNHKNANSYHICMQTRHYSNCWETWRHIDTINISVAWIRPCCSVRMVGFCERQVVGVLSCITKCQIRQKYHRCVYVFNVCPTRLIESIYLLCIIV